MAELESRKKVCFLALLRRWQAEYRRWPPDHSTARLYFGLLQARGDNSAQQVNPKTYEPKTITMDRHGMRGRRPAHAFGLQYNL